MKLKTITLSVSTAMILLTGCGNSTSEETDTSLLATGYYVDSAIEGVPYRCGAQSGITDKDGAFIFEKGEDCHFFLGDLILRDVPSDILEDGKVIIEDNITKAAFLQTLDVDGNANNGIQIDQSIIDFLKNEQLTSIPQSEAELTTLWNSIKNSTPSYNGKIVDFYQAQQHIEQTKAKIAAQQNNHSNHKQQQTPILAYYGDKETNRIVVIDIDSMRQIDEIPTGHSKTYAAEIVKLSHTPTAHPKMYIDNRGSDAIDVLDSQTNTIVKTISLPFHPRSISVNTFTGLVAVSGTDKPMTAIIDANEDTVIAVVGENNTTYPTTSGHDYISSGTLACGHPQWLDDKHFVLIDRQNRQISTYKIEKDTNDIWQTTMVNTVITPSPVHNLIPPKVHGKAGHTTRDHKTDNHNTTTNHALNNRYSTLFYATAEGAENIYPSILELSFTPDEGLKITDNLEIKKEGVSPNIMGVHHLNFLANQKYIYVGSDEGNLFIVDYENTPMQIVKILQAGKGAGHTDELQHGDLAVVINHKDRFITVVNTQTHTKIADINVSEIPQTLIGNVQTQSHPQYHFSKDGRYFYLFLTEEGALVKVDLLEKRVVQRLEIGGKLAMGSFTGH